MIELYFAKMELIEAKLAAYQAWHEALQRLAEAEDSVFADRNSQAWLDVLNEHAYWIKCAGALEEHLQRERITQWTAQSTS